MKKKEKLIALFLISIGIIYFSCQKENFDIANKESIDIANNVISPEVLEKIASLGLNTDNVRFETFTRPDGSIDQCYIVENCYQISPEQLNEMTLPEKNTTKQYRTTNLVNQPYVIKVLGYLTYDERMRCTFPRSWKTGLKRAIDNFNQLNLQITFQLDFGRNNLNNYDIIVYESDSLEGFMGYSEFPSGGKPGKWLQLHSDLKKGYSLDYIEGVITHEIGHSIGLRHTNWKENGESASPNGAIHIPATPRGGDITSIMNTTSVTIGTTGEFNCTDVLALYYLYNYKRWQASYRLCK